MKAFMRQNDFVGGTLAIVKDGRLVFARAYLHAKPPFEPIKVESLFRIASCSKPITCVGIYQLHKSKALKPDDKVLDILELEPPPDSSGIQKDAIPQNKLTRGHYFHKIEVQHLLNHLGGWNWGEGSLEEPTWKRMTRSLQPSATSCRSWTPTRSPGGQPPSRWISSRALLPPARGPTAISATSFSAA